jgi:hypothetical protein
LCIKEVAYQADFAQSERANDAAMELSRLALLGVAGYGFLLKEVAMANGHALNAVQQYGALIIAGATLLGLAACFALYTRELSVQCTAYQLSILRTFTKLENGGWSQSDTVSLQADLSTFRDQQRSRLRIARLTLRAAHWLLISGTLLTVLNFAVVLLAARPEVK